MKIAVLGAGVIGLSIARALRRHDITVTVVDRARPGSGASDAAAGMLAPQLEAAQPGPLFSLCAASRALYASWVHELEHETGSKVGFRECGALEIAFDDLAAKSLEEKCRWQRKEGLEATLLSPQELHDLEPEASPRALAAAYYPREAQCEPRRLIRALTLATLRAGATLHTAVARRVRVDNDQVIGIELDDAVLEVDAVVVACGAWTGILEGTSLNPGAVHPVKGQLIEVAHPHTRVRRLLKSGLRYVVPRDDGRFVLGTTVERVGDDTSVTVGATFDILNGALSLLPPLHDAEFISSWAGLRPGTSDELPIISQGANSGVWLATGHYRNGILLAPVTANLVSDLIVHGKSIFDARAFEIDTRRPGFNITASNKFDQRASFAK